MESKKEEEKDSVFVFSYNINNSKKQVLLSFHF